MIALSLQHMRFIATVSVATSQNTFSATMPTDIFGHSQKNFWTASFGILANTLHQVLTSIFPQCRDKSITRILEQSHYVVIKWIHVFHQPFLCIVVYLCLADKAGIKKLTWICNIYVT